MVDLFHRDNMLNFFLCSLEHQQMIGCDLSELDKQSLKQQRPPIINVRQTVVDVATIPARSANADCINTATVSSSNYVDVTTKRRRMIVTLDEENEQIDAELEAKTLHQLRKFYDDPDATFTSIEQACALAIVLKRQDDLLVVLATGQGKSLLFFLPAYCKRDKGKTTVVVVPLVALTADMIDGCKRHDLTYDTWHSSFDTLTRVNILFVAVENCNSIGLKSYLSRLNNAGRLARIVFDEAHLSLTWNDWRPAMNYCHTIRQVDVPIVLLSATVPPQLELKLKLAYSSDFVTIRQSTTARAELEYSVEKVRGTDRMPGTLLQRVSELIAERLCASIIIYLLERSTAEFFQREIKAKCGIDRVFVYHGAMSVEDRKSNQDGFMENTQEPTVMCCTSAFALGIDKPDVYAVIQYGICDSILDYAQAAGRAKRVKESFVGPGFRLVFMKNALIWERLMVLI